MKMFLAATNLGCGNKAQKGVGQATLAGGLTSRRSQFLATPARKEALFSSEARPHGELRREYGENRMYHSGGRR
jgi:hypothetical protein